MITANGILGNIHQDDTLADTYESYREADKVEHVVLDREDARRSRLRTKTDCGTDVGIVVTEQAELSPGDVLALEDDRMITVEFERREVFVISFDQEIDAQLACRAAALGHVVGNRHWNLAIRDEHIYVPVTEDEQLMKDVLQRELPAGATMTTEHSVPDELTERAKRHTTSYWNAGGHDHDESHDHTGAHHHKESHHSVHAPKRETDDDR